MSKASLFKTPRRKKFEVPEPMVQEIVYLITQDYNEYTQYSHLQNSVPNFNIRAVRANYLAYQSLSSRDQTIELTFYAIDQYYTVRDVNSQAGTLQELLDIIRIVPKCKDIYDVIIHLINKQQVIDELSGVNDFDRILNSCPKLCAMISPDVITKVRLGQSVW